MQLLNAPFVVAVLILLVTSVRTQNVINDDNPDQLATTCETSDDCANGQECRLAVCEDRIVELNRTCVVDSECWQNELCRFNEYMSNDLQSTVFTCECAPGSQNVPGEGCQMVAESNCESNVDCGPNRQCMLGTNVLGISIRRCQCTLGFTLDQLSGLCVAQRCQDWCFQSGLGDTCRLNECLRCWAGESFMCNEFLPPNVIVIRRHSFGTFWVSLFFFILFAVIIFSAVKCCLSYGRKPSTLPASTTTAMADNRSSPSTTVKMPMSDVAELQTESFYHHVPPPTYNSVRQAS